MTKGTKHFRMTMHSSPKHIHRVEKFLQRVNRSAHLDEIQFNKVLISTTEAVNNAIFHGNKSDPQKNVYLACELSKERMILRVRDSGAGFDPHKIANPLDESNLLRESGRGIFLMRTLMDKVQYHLSEDGSEVEMVLLLVK
ncbi:MAG: ATP-binding protein [Bacteroidota bacterium]